MSESMIERVARAISGAPFPSAASYRKARAAIEAMREPTDAMIDVGQDVFAEGINLIAGHPEPSDEAAYQTYRAMIDTALNKQVAG